jgi:hypothetical protein
MKDTQVLTITRIVVSGIWVQIDVTAQIAGMIPFFLAGARHTGVAMM